MVKWFSRFVGWIVFAAAVAGYAGLLFLANMHSRLFTQVWFELLTAGDIMLLAGGLYWGMLTSTQNKKQVS